MFGNKQVFRCKIAFCRQMASVHSFSKDVGSFDLVKGPSAPVRVLFVSHQLDEGSPSAPEGSFVDYQTSMVKHSKAIAVTAQEMVTFQKTVV